MRIAVSPDGKNINEPRIIPTSQDNFEEGLKIFKQTADELSKGQKIEAVAGGIAVAFNEDKSIPVGTSHLHGWINKPLKAELNKLFQAPVFLDNDTAVVGLGEATQGAGINHNLVAYLTISTGIGGARIVNKQIDRNTFGFEPGHQVIVIDGENCHCGGKGHFEAYVGGWYLEKKYGKKAEEISDPAVWDEVARYLAVGLNNSIVHWSPDIVVLGGSVMKSISLDKVKTYLKDYLTIFPKTPEIVLSSMGDFAGLHGALELITSGNY